MRKAILAALLAASCAHSSDEKIDQLSKQVKALNDRVDGLEQKMNVLASWSVSVQKKLAGDNDQPEEKRPDPDAVYAVPIDDEPALGPKTALVTIVEAADFG